MPDLNRLKDEVERGLSAVRTTKTKLLVMGSCEYRHRQGKHEGFSILKKRGCFEIKWHGDIEVESEESRQCDMGHRHQLKKDTHFVWNYCELSAGDVAAIIEFLRESR